jgi:hypothetical protein
MYQRSLARLAGKSRTIVRDPRKKSLPAVRRADLTPQAQQPPPVHPMPLPFQPNQHLQQSVGSSFGSMVLTGAGVSLGFILVGAIFGGF